MRSQAERRFADFERMHEPTLGRPVSRVARRVRRMCGGGAFPLQAGGFRLREHYAGYRHTESVREIEGDP